MEVDDSAAVGAESRGGGGGEGTRRDVDEEDRVGAPRVVAGVDAVGGVEEGGEVAGVVRPTPRVVAALVAALGRAAVETGALVLERDDALVKTRGRGEVALAAAVGGEVGVGAVVSRAREVAQDGVAQDAEGRDERSHRALAGRPDRRASVASAGVVVQRATRAGTAGGTRGRGRIATSRTVRRAARVRRGQLVQRTTLARSHRRDQAAVARRAVRGGAPNVSVQRSLS